MGKRGVFTCAHCNRNFSTKFAVNRHIQSIHINNKCSKSNRKYNLKCPYCSVCFYNSLRINYHLINEHDIKLEETHLSFSSEDEFEKWKEKMETETRSSYSRRTLSRNCGNMSLTVYYRCHRSGVYTSDSKGKRSHPLKGSCKTGNYCAAHIKRYDVGEKINITFCGVHTGHTHEMCYLRLPKSVKTLVAKKVQDGISLDHILNEIRDEAISSEMLEKKHLINRKSLHNIVYKYNLSSVVKYHDDDLASVDILYTKCKSMDTNPIRVYKKFAQPFGDLCTKDMMLVIMTEEQREMLQKFGCDKICIDSTHNSDKFKLQLTSIFVLDEFGVAFPACYCISNKVEENTLTVLLQEIKNLVGIIEAKVFMSDDIPCYYNSWKNVMTEVKHNIIFKWCIDRAWRKNLDKVPEKEAKCEIYAMLRTLMEERSKELFENSLQSFLKHLDNRGYKEFKQFFISTYGTRPQVWAECYRDDDFFNMSMALEASHKALKQLYSKSCQNNRLDVIIQILLKTIRDKTFKRMINLNAGYPNTYFDDIVIRHHRAKHVKNILEVYEQEWKVESLSKNVKHSVRKITNNCSCQQKCLVCKVCIHMYACSCNDYFISRHLCKHIHAVVQFLNANDNSHTSHISLNTVDDNIIADGIDQQEIEEELITCSEEDVFTNQLMQINDLWDDGNGIKKKDSNDTRRLCELASEMLNILLDHRQKYQLGNNGNSITEMKSFEESFVSSLPLLKQSNAEVIPNSQPDVLESFVQTTSYL